jgi:hypothetical protein
VKGRLHRPSVLICDDQRLVAEALETLLSPAVERIEHRLHSHGPDNMEQSTDGMNNQQGRMECLMCHANHTKEPK